MTRRRRVALELGALGAGAALYLALLPRRPAALDAALAVLALGAVAWSASRDPERIWGPVPGPRRERLRRATGRMAALTLPVVGLFAAWRVGRDVAAGAGWSGAAAGLAPGALAAVLPLYVAWALVQQALVQRYLLDRLRVLLPSAPPLLTVTVSGLLFGAVHLPDWSLAALVAVAGAAWSDCYRRHRLLLPVALSHAVLGATYFAWVRRIDLLRGWLGLG